MKTTKAAPTRLGADARKEDEAKAKNDMLSTYETSRLKNKQKKINTRDREAETLARLSPSEIGSSNKTLLI